MDMNRKIIIGIAIVVLAGASFLFREKISGLLTFEQETPTENGNSPVTGTSTTSVEAPTGNKPSESKPPYTGRDPGEFRPVPEEVKLFTEAQREQLRATLQSHANAVKKDSAYFSGWIQVGLLKKTIGDFQGAADAWEYAGVIQPLNSLSFANLGELYWRYIPNFPRSEANLKTSIKHKADDLQTYTTLAELYHYSYKEKYELADDVLLDGLKANPGSDTLMRRLAFLYEQRKEYANALEWWQKVLEKNSGDTEVQASIDKVKAKLVAQ